MDVNEILETWAQSAFDKAKLQELKATYPEMKELNIAEQVVRETAALQVSFDTSHEELWNGMQGKIAEQANTSKIIPFYRSAVFRVAASVVLLLGLIMIWQWLNPSLIQHQTTFAQLESIPLPDGSIVRLNANSTLSYQEDGWEEQRNLELTGEAFFMVEKGSPFTVTTKNGAISVLGTSFNVKSRDSLFTVQCKTGRVEVVHESQIVELSEGDVVRLRKGRLVAGEESTTSIGSWFIGTFYFKDASLREVLMEIEHQFDVEVQTKGIDRNVRYNGFFKNNDLMEALEAVCIPLSLEFTIDKKNKRVVIQP